MRAIKDLKTVPVGDYSSYFISTVTPDTPLSEVKELMESGKFRHLPVMDKDKAVGVISERDHQVVTNLQFAGKLSASDLMSPSPYQVSADVPLREVVAEMARQKIGSVLIKDSTDRVTGIFTSTDALYALHELLGEEIITNSEEYKLFTLY